MTDSVGSRRPSISGSSSGVPLPGSLNDSERSTPSSGSRSHISVSDVAAPTGPPAGTFLEDRGDNKHGTISGEALPGWAQSLDAQGKTTVLALAEIVQRQIPPGQQDRLAATLYVLHSMKVSPEELHDLSATSRQRDATRELAQACSGYLTGFFPAGWVAKSLSDTGFKAWKSWLAANATIGVGGQAHKFAAKEKGLGAIYNRPIASAQSDASRWGARLSTAGFAVAHGVVDATQDGKTAGQLRTIASGPAGALAAGTVRLALWHLAEKDAVWLDGTRPEAMRKAITALREPARVAVEGYAGDTLEGLASGALKTVLSWEGLAEAALRTVAASAAQVGRLVAAEGGVTDDTARKLWNILGADVLLGCWAGANEMVGRPFAKAATSQQVSGVAPPRERMEDPAPRPADFATQSS